MIRRYDLDWLRVLTVLLLVPFHSFLIFVLDPNSIVYVKDDINSMVFARIAGLIHQFHMPLLFTISGAAAFYSLRNKSSLQFINERLKRLFIPFIFGIITLIPLMTYITRVWRKENISFINHYFNFFKLNVNDLAGLNGTITPAHLWFIMFLFIYSLLALPIFKHLNKYNTHFFTNRFTLFLLFFPILLVAAFDILGDKNPLVYFLFFIYGYIIISNNKYQETINKNLLFYLILAFLIEIYRQLTFNIFIEWTPLWILREVLSILNRWVFVLAFLGLGNRFLNYNNNLLQYLNKAAFPFYILHLPINTLIAFYIIKLDVVYFLKYIIIVILTAFITFIIYEIIRRSKITRILFGIK